jgi:superoxide reductase
MKKMEIYRCSHCKLQLEVTAEAGVPAPICCGEPMSLQVANTQDAAKEKHVPVLETPGDGILVKVGSVAHPMTEEHYIEWIEVLNGNYVNRCYLKPGDLPQAAFYVAKSPKLVVRASCNIHGVWQMPKDGEQA